MATNRHMVRGYVDDIVYRKLRLAVSRPDVTISKTVNDALDHWLSKERADNQIGALIRRLDRMSRNQDSMKHRQVVLLESQGLFVRHFLATIPQVAEEDKAAAKAEGARRYELFREMLRQILTESTRGFLGPLEDSVVGESEFFTFEELELLHKPAPARPAQQEAENE